MCYRKKVMAINKSSKNASIKIPLSQEEELELIKRAQKGDQSATDELFIAHFQLIQFLASQKARNYANKYNLEKDLFSEGVIGFLKALEKFNPSTGNRLATYADKFIKGAISAYLEKISLVPPSDYASKKIQKLKKYEDALSQELGREPSCEELAKAMRTSIEEVRKIELLKSKFCSINAPNNPLGEALESPALMEEMLEFFLNPVMTNKVIENLSHRERQILDMRFGISAGKPKTQQEIAKALKLSRPTVMAMEKRIIAKIFRLRTQTSLPDSPQD